MTPPFDLRPALPADAHFLQILYARGRAGEVAAWRWEVAAAAAFLAQQARVREEFYRLQFPGAQDEIVEVAGTPVGRRLVHRGADIRLVDLALLPEHRGQGLGRALLEALLLEARNRSCPVRLRVARDNPAQRLYARVGFQAVFDGAADLLMEWLP